MNKHIQCIIMSLLLSIIVASTVKAIDFPHDESNGISCNNCHYKVSINSVGYFNICISCHSNTGMAKNLHSFPSGDASNIFNNVTSRRIGTIRQTSHNWGMDKVASLVVPKAGAVQPLSTALNDDPLVGISCARCHDIHVPRQSATNSPPFLRTLNDRDQMCLDCHSPRKSTNHSTGSHPVTMTYTSAIKRFDRYTTKFYKTPINANPANSSSAMDLSKGGQILCSTCHGLHYADSNSSTFDNASSAVLNRLVPGDGFLLRTDMRGATPGAINICTNCHKGKKSHNARGQNIQCADCHAAHVDEADGTVPNVWLLRRFMVYSTGTNKLNNRTNGIPTFFQSTSTKNYTDAKGTGICQSCHAVPVTVAGMSHPTVNCNNCHSHDSASGTFAATLPEPHYSDSTASYVAKNSLCTDCHNEAANNVAIRKSWAASGHADEYSFAWSAHDFKFQSGCVQCHTTTGFIAYSSGKVTAAWGNPADTTKELLACNACHTDIASGALRSPAIISPYLNNSYRNQDAGPSNICVGCHSGRVSGNSIKALSSVNTNFISSHLYAAAGILFNSIGYEFSDRDYSNKAHFKHDKIGINNYTGYGYSTGKQGPCIACHMSTANKHSFSPLTKDKSGVVTAISSTICVGCHTAPAFLNADRMNSRKARFSTSLLALQKMLENKGMIYVADHPPYFYNSLNTAAAFTNWGSADTMGAAFNLHLLTHEPGAYAHNMVYAKRLIYDSIDYLDDGEFNSSVSAAVNALTSLEEAQKSTAIGYLTKAGARP